MANHPRWGYPGERQCWFQEGRYRSSRYSWPEWDQCCPHQRHAPQRCVSRRSARCNHAGRCKRRNRRCQAGTRRSRCLRTAELEGWGIIPTRVIGLNVDVGILRGSVIVQTIHRRCIRRPVAGWPHFGCCHHRAHLDGSCHPLCRY